MRSETSEVLNLFRENRDEAENILQGIREYLRGLRYGRPPLLYRLLPGHARRLRRHDIRICLNHARVLRQHVRAFQRITAALESENIPAAIQILDELCSAPVATTEAEKDESMERPLYAIFCRPAEFRNYLLVLLGKLTLLRHVQPV